MLAHAGNHDSGKTTVIRALGRPGSSDRSAGTTSNRKDKGKAAANSQVDRPDLGINFKYIDIADDGESGEGVSWHNLHSGRVFIEEH